MLTFVNSIVAIFYIFSSWYSLVSTAAYMTVDIDIDEFVVPLYYELFLPPSVSTQWRYSISTPITITCLHGGTVAPLLDYSVVFH